MSNARLNRSYLYRKTIDAIRDLSKMVGVLSEEELAEARELLAAHEEGRLVYDQNNEAYIVKPRPVEMKTCWFTFGFNHVHHFRGFRLDRDIVLEITAYNPREVMVFHFGQVWAFEAEKPPQMKYYPRGCVTLDDIIRNTDEYVTERTMLVD